MSFFKLDGQLITVSSFYPKFPIFILTDIILCAGFFAQADMVVI